MAGGHDDDDPGFWPGYVAATAGLVQGMLIMAMALGISIFALGTLSSGGQDVSVRPAGPGGALNAPPDLPALAPVRELARIGQPAAPPIPDDALRPIRVSFEGDATVTPLSTASVIGDGIAARRSLGVQRWLLVSTADLSDPRQNRASYVRIMGVRAVLMDLGVPSTAIEMRMENSGASASEEGGGTVLIEPLVSRNAASSSPLGGQP
jgi:hypothetical protein